MCVTSLLIGNQEVYTFIQWRLHSGHILKKRLLVSKENEMESYQNSDGKRVSRYTNVTQAAIMGGCRCSYRNCTSRTDGVTHMFHYPVFDKVRCHQWLTNAQKLEFLNLKVSQLKNRVVCQHHFRDDNFMNFLKDKLTFDAVPTLDGPYCDTSQMYGNVQVQDDSKLYSISLDDIENEYLTFNDKKANFSVKYGDFLTNCDLMDLDSTNVTNENTQIKTNHKILQDQSDITLYDDYNRKKVVTMNPVLNQNLKDMKKNESIDNIFTIQLTEVPIEIAGMQANLMIPIDNVPNDSENTTANLGNNPKMLSEPSKVVNNNSTSKIKGKKKITIIDEQKISEPVGVTYPVKLEPVCPSAILPLPNKRKNLNLNKSVSEVNQHNNNTSSGGHLDLVDSRINLEQVPIVETEVNRVKTLQPIEKPKDKRILEQSNSKSQKSNIKENNVTPQRPCSVNPFSINNKVSARKTNNSLLKNKIPPERMAAIEEKRKFNMKLRDIIASCLDKLDDEDGKDCGNSKLKSRIENNITQKVSSYLAKEPEMPNIHDYSVAYLEARMKKMENILLRKIDQNSQRIIELKHSLAPNADKKSAHTQTVMNEEVRKKNLYQEISKYLSPEANSLLYEELFINNHLKKNSPTTPVKRRKCKR